MGSNCSGGRCGFAFTADHTRDCGLFASFMENRLIVSAFTGIRAAVVGLVAAAAVRITGANCRSIGAVVLAFLSLVINLFTGIHAMWVIVSGALVGIVLYYLPRRGNSKIPGDELQ